MRKLLLTLILCLYPVAAFAQFGTVVGINAAANITVGTSIVTGGNSTGVLFNNSGVIGADPGFTYGGTGKPVAFGSAVSAAFGTTGVSLIGNAYTQTDSTTGAGTVATAYGSLIGANTLATAVNAVTITNAYDVYFKAPLAGAHTTLTNAWALGADNFSSPGNITGLNLTAANGGSVIVSGNNGTFSMRNNGTILSSPSNGVLQLGPADSAGGTAYTFQGNSIAAGNANTAAPTTIFAGGKSNGSGGGEFDIDVTQNIAASGTQNVLQKAIAIIGGSALVELPQITTGSVVNAVCDTAAQALIVDAANCIGSKREWKQDFIPITESVAFRNIAMLASDAVDYRYTDKHLGADADKPHARDRQPGFIADDLAKMDFRDASGKPIQYATYDITGAPAGVRYEQFSADAAVAINALKAQVMGLRAENAHLRAANDSFDRRLGALEHPRRKVASLK